DLHRSERRRAQRRGHQADPDPDALSRAQDRCSRRDPARGEAVLPQPQLLDAGALGDPSRLDHEVGRLVGRLDEAGHRELSHSGSQPQPNASPKGAMRDAYPLGMRTVARILLGLFLLLAGIGHLTFGREAFLAQVPPWVPLDADLVVVLSGLVEIAVGAALLVTRGRNLAIVGWLTAALFVAVFPGNVAQWMEGRDAFGLDTDRARFGRLFLQPVLIVWALWSTG